MLRKGWAIADQTVSNEFAYFHSSLRAETWVVQAETRAPPKMGSERSVLLLWLGLIPTQFRCHICGVLFHYPAMASELPDLDLVQVVQSAAFLSGNLATEHMRCFNVVGPLGQTDAFPKCIT